MSKEKLVTWVLATVGAILLIAPGYAGAESFGQALAAAWRNNPNMRAARANQRAAQSDLSTAEGGWYPQLSVEARLARNHTTGTISMFAAPQDISANLNQASIALRLDQPLYQGGRLSSGIAASKDTLSASRAQSHVSAATVLLNAAKAYLNTIAAQKLLKVQSDNVDVITRQLNAAKTALKHGEGTNTDVAQAKSRLQAAMAQRIRAQSKLAQMQALYRTVIGHPPSKLAMPSSLPNLPATLDQARLLAQRNYHVQAAHYNALAANHKASVADAAKMPKVSLFAEVQRAHDPQYGFDRLNGETIGLSLSAPIWNGGTLRSKAASAHARADAAKLKANAAMDDALQNIVATWHDYAASRAALGAEQSRLTAARTASSGVADEHRYGERTLLDVLDAEQEVRNARAAVIQARRDRIVAAYSLLAATGQLSASQLHLAVGGMTGDQP